MSSDGIAGEPLVQALLRHLATTRSNDEPLSSFARTVLSGEATLQEAARHSWHGEGITKGINSGLEARATLSTDQLAAIERDAVRLREPSGTTDTTDGDARR